MCLRGQREREGQGLFFSAPASQPASQPGQSGSVNLKGRPFSGSDWELGASAEGGPAARRRRRRRTRRCCRSTSRRPPAAWRRSGGPRAAPTTAPGSPATGGGSAMAGPPSSAPRIHTCKHSHARRTGAHTCAHSRTTVHALNTHVLRRHVCKLQKISKV